MKKKHGEEKQKSEDLENDLIQEADQEIEQIDDDKISKLEDQLKRAIADYQNLERRVDENKREWVLSSNRSLVEKLLPVLDNLFLAQKHIQDDGLNLSIQKFLDVLSQEGVQRIETEEVEFDPNTMECVSVQEGEENKVLEEVRPGYIMNDRVLRPSQVIVGGKLVN
jgi:molecular chaperone GrpE